MTLWSRYGKFVAQVVATVMTAVAAATAGDGQIDASEAANVILAGLGAVAVLGAGNLPSGVWSYTKTIAAVATAAAMAWQSALGDGITTAEWWQIAIAALGAAGVLAAPSARVYDALAVAQAGADLRHGPVN